LSEGKGDPLVLVPGSNTKLQAWNFQISYFKDKMNVISLDNRGSGKSSRPNYPYSLEMFVEDLKNLLDHLKIEKKIHLCGSSLGGFIGLKFVLKYPEKVKTLILCATGAEADQTGVNQRFKLYEDFVKMDMEQMINTIMPNLFSRKFRKKLKENEELSNQIKNDMNFITYYNDPPRYEDYINQLSALKNYDIRDKLQHISQPVLIMVGTKDILTPLEESELLHEKLPNSKLEVFQGVGHGFTIEIADEVNKLMWNFIQEHLE
jgi:proline-specific peptidase